jgi:hypothetical protein
MYAKCSNIGGYGKKEVQEVVSEEAIIEGEDDN